MSVSDLTRIGQIAINAHDVERATQFYRDILGLELLFEVSGMAFFNCGGVRLMLSLASAPEYDHPGSVLYYAVSDIRRTHAKLKNKGVRFESVPHKIADMPDHELWMAFFRDSEENMLALMSEVRKA
jgi:catechol 2,3-dioxygenase-like lactoylglutathione lyase family enzyme